MDSNPPARNFEAPLHAGSDGAVLPGVVHDLGNLIQIAASAVNVIGRSAHDGRDGALEPILARARAALERAGVLVRQTMDRTREPTVTAHDAPEPQDIAACLGEVGGLIRWACEPDIRLVIDAPSDLPTASCNRVALQSAVLNLIINARDAMPDGGILTLSARRLDTGFPGPEIEIRVTDDGVGMPPETLERVFAPYFTTKPEGRGAGLGLPMVRRFALEAGGQVGIESTLGAGTSVAIRLPATDRA